MHSPTNFEATPGYVRSETASVAGSDHDQAMLCNHLNASAAPSSLPPTAPYGQGSAPAGSPMLDSDEESSARPRRGGKTIVIPDPRSSGKALKNAPRDGGKGGDAATLAAAVAPAAVKQNTLKAKIDHAGTARAVAKSDADARSVNKPVSDGDDICASLPLSHLVGHTILLPIRCRTSLAQSSVVNCF